MRSCPDHRWAAVSEPPARHPYDGAKEGEGMAYELSVEPRRSYLHIRVTGNNTTETLRDYLADIRRICEKQKCRDVLIEEHLTGTPLGTFDVFSIVTAEAEHARSVMGRIAFVDCTLGRPTDLQGFAENVAVNRGVNVRIFGDIPSAEQWLTTPGDAPGVAPGGHSERRGR
jgi:hypothetical protein